MEYLGTDKPVNKIDPMVSVCVETYQHIDFIKTCLDSILSQKTDFHYELIIGEDESKDGTREICKKYAEKYPDKIRLFLRSQEDVIRINSTATGRYNLIQNIKEARGKYIAHCAGDDYWIDDLKLQKQVDFLEKNSDFNFSMGKVKMLQNESNKITSKIEYISPVLKTSFTIKHYLKAGPFSVISSFLYRNKNFTFPDWFKQIIAGDQCLVIFMSGDGKIKYHNEFFTVYRQSKTNISSKRKANTNKQESFLYLNKINGFTHFKHKKIIERRKKLINIFSFVNSLKNTYLKSIFLFLYRSFKMIYYRF